MAILKLSPEELEAVKEDEKHFIMSSYNKDLTVQRLRPSAQHRAIHYDQDTYSFIRDTLDVIVPLANSNGTPITFNLLSTVLGIDRESLRRHINVHQPEPLNATEAVWQERIRELLRDTLRVARTDVESLRLSRKIDSNAAGKAIDEIDNILDETLEQPTAKVSVQLVDDLD